MSSELISTHEIESIQCDQPEEGNLMYEEGRGGKPRLRCHITDDSGRDTVYVDYVDIEGSMEVSVGNRSVEMNAHIHPHEPETCAVVERTDGETRVMDCIENSPEAYYG